MKKLIAFVVLMVLLYSCYSSTFYHDATNPCTLGDSTECNAWKRKYPKDYNKYIIRREKAIRN